MKRLIGSFFLILPGLSPQGVLRRLDFIVIIRRFASLRSFNSLKSSGASWKTVINCFSLAYPPLRPLRNHSNSKMFDGSFSCFSGTRTKVLRRLENIVVARRSLPLSFNSLFPSGASEKTVINSFSLAYPPLRPKTSRKRAIFDLFSAVFYTFCTNSTTSGWPHVCPNFEPLIVVSRRLFPSFQKIPFLWLQRCKLCVLREKAVSRSPPLAFSVDIIRNYHW